MESQAVARLSARQRDCLRLVGALMKTEQIAAELGISPSTVNTHIERAVILLGAPNRREAARLVLAYEAGDPDKIPTETSRLPQDPAAESIEQPPATRIGRRRNDLTWTERLALAMLALVLLCVAIAGLGAAIGQLSEWRSSLAP